jgi:hypothetical protein
VQTIGVHGSTDQHAAIRRAVRAPFLDLRHHNARALCEDFTPAVAAHLAHDSSTGSGATCETRVSNFFQLAQTDGEYVSAANRMPLERLQVLDISWHGTRATASSRNPQIPGSELHWQLQLLSHGWQIATPASLQEHSDCRNHPFGAPGCIYAMSMQFAAAR